MTTLSRVTGKVFGGNAPLEECGVFGSAKLNNPTNSIDIATIQSGTAYDEGWEAGVVTDKNFPPIEEVTGVLKTISYQACYLLQEGIPTYDSETEYSATSIVKTWIGNTLELYKSKVDGNKGHALTDTTYWVKAEVLGTRDVGVPQITLTPNTLPINCVWLEGQLDYLADADCLYPRLRDLYGTSYNLGNEPTGQYRLPDFRNKYICGLGINNDNTTNLSMGYVKAGLPYIGTYVDGGHEHGVGEYTVTGRVNRIGRTSSASPYTSGAFEVDMTHITTSGFYSSTSSYALDLIMQAEAGTGFSGTSDYAGEHAHNTYLYPSEIRQKVDYGISTVKTDGVKVRVYTRYQ